MNINRPALVHTLRDRSVHIMAAVGVLNIGAQLYVGTPAGAVGIIAGMCVAGVLLVGCLEYMREEARLVNGARWAEQLAELEAQKEEDDRRRAEREAERAVEREAAHRLDAAWHARQTLPYEQRRDWHAMSDPTAHATCTPDTCEYLHLVDANMTRVANSSANS